MGIFKQLRDAKDMINAAPGMVSQAQQMAAQAQEMAAAQQAAMQAQMAQAGMAQAGGMAGAPGAAPTGPDFEPIAGVALDQYAAVSKGVAAYNYDQSKLVEIAASRGIPAPAWEAAFIGWNERIKRNPAVAKHFNTLYRAS